LWQTTSCHLPSGACYDLAMTDPDKIAKRRATVQKAQQRLREKRDAEGYLQFVLFLPPDILNWLDTNRGKRSRQQAMLDLLQHLTRTRAPIPKAAPTED